MNAVEIHTRLNAIAANTNDPETARKLEHHLYEDFIHHVADDGATLGELARLVLTSKAIDFPRWSI
jgi:hypothetical protein